MQSLLAALQSELSRSKKENPSNHLIKYLIVSIFSFGLYSFLLKCLAVRFRYFASTAGGISVFVPYSTCDAERSMATGMVRYTLF